MAKHGEIKVLSETPFRQEVAAVLQEQNRAREAGDDFTPPFRVYRFPTWKLEEFTTKFKRLQTRAKKLKIDPPTWKESRIMEVYRVKKGRGNWRREIEIGVFSKPVKLPGYRFVATIDHKGEAGNIVRQHPQWEGTLPMSMRKAKASWCDHCQTERMRNDTYVVEKEETGQLVRVGSSCLKDFTGRKDGSWIARAMTFEADLYALGSDAEGGYGGFKRSAWPQPAVYVVAQAQNIIRQEGWVSAGAVYNGLDATPTKVLVSSVIVARVFPPKRYRGQLPWELEPKYVPNETDVRIATDALLWARAIPENTTSDYLHNLRLLANLNTIEDKEVGLIVSIIPAYMRELEKEVKRKQFAKKNEGRGKAWIANEGDKFGRKLSKKDKAAGVAALPAFEATVTGFKWFTNDYGATAKVTFEDADRNVIIWWASNPVAKGVAPVRDLEIGDKVTLQGTVKKLTEYKDTKQTVLTRAIATVNP